MSKRMCKQVKTMVSAMNKYFKESAIKDEHNTDFVSLQWMLILADCYHGYNYFKADGTLSGGQNEGFHHLEFYIV